MSAEAPDSLDGPAEAPSVVFRRVTKRYPGADAPALAELDLEVAGGEICVFVGPSGSGKTTAMRMVNRMVEITEGEILVGGRSVRERSPAELRREIGYVIQQIGLFPHRTVADNIATVPQPAGLGGPARRGAGSRSCSSWSGSTRLCASASRPSSRAASSSASAWPARSPPTPA